MFYSSGGQVFPYKTYFGASQQTAVYFQQKTKTVFKQRSNYSSKKFQKRTAPKTEPLKKKRKDKVFILITYVYPF